MLQDVTALIFMVNCGNKTEKKIKTGQGIKFYCVPAVITNEREKKKMDICNKQRRLVGEKSG